MSSFDMSWKDIIKAGVSEWLITIKEGKGAGPKKRERFVGTKQESKKRVQEVQGKYTDARITIRRLSKK